MKKLVVMAICVVGCATPMSDRFTRMDKSFEPARHDARPVVIIDVDEFAAVAPFKSVGIIEVQGREKESLNAYVDRAQGAGAKLGCDVVVQRDAFRLGIWNRRAPSPGEWVVGHGRDWTPNDEAVWQFVCGVNGASVDEAVQTHRNAIKVAAQMRDVELDSQVCVPYIPLGSRIRKLNVCENDPHHSAYH